MKSSSFDIESVHCSTIEMLCKFCKYEEAGDFLFRSRTHLQTGRKALSGLPGEFTGDGTRVPNLDCPKQK